MAVSLNTALGAFPITALAGTGYVPLAGGTMTGNLTLISPALGVFSPGMYLGSGSDGLWTPLGLELKSTGVFQFSSTTNATATADVVLARDAAATLAQRNGTNQQSFSVYNTYTDSSNYERLKLTGVAGTSVNITAESLGTGAANLDVVITPKGTGRVMVPAGVSATPGVCFGGLSGIWQNAALSFMGIRGNTSGASDMILGAGVIRFGSTHIVGWSNNVEAAGGSFDTGFARESSGLVALTTGSVAAYRDLKLRNLLAGGGNGSYVQTPSMTVDRLADAATAGAGARAFVTDANATTFLSTVAAGGSNKVPVVSNGTNWLIG